MKKVVELTMDKQEQYEIIKALSEGKINKTRAEAKLGVTRRHVNRSLRKYREEGKATFVHGNTGRNPKHALTDEKKKEIVSLYNKKYYDANFTHASQLMKRNDGAIISPSALRKLMLAEDVLSPRAHRSTRRNLQKRLRARQKAACPKVQKTTSKVRSSLPSRRIHAVHVPLTTAKLCKWMPPCTYGSGITKPNCTSP